MAFATQEDIGNRALQHCGARLITSFSDTSRNAQQVSFAYDKLRAAELRRTVWRFATRRAVLRPLSATSFQFVPALWSNAITYSAGAVVRDSSGIYWVCLISNIGRTPGVPVTGFPAFWAQYFGPTVGDAWSASTTYYAGDIVYVGSTFYMSLTNNSVGLNPPTRLDIWLQQPAPSATIGTTLIYPAGPGFTVGSSNRNIFPLPHGYLRLAAPDKRAASTSVYATTGGIYYRDWAIENDVLISNDTVIAPFRFVADVSDVTLMDALFCEALSARLGYEICETLTQSQGKQQAIGTAYQKFMRDARVVNQIEIGSTEAEEDALPLTAGPQGAPQSPPATAQA